MGRPTCWPTTARQAVAVGSAPLHAISGRSGKLLWSISDVSVRIIGASLALAATDLDGDASPEVIWLAAVDYDYPAQSIISVHDVQLRLFVADGRTGKLKWSQPLSPGYGQTPGSAPPQLQQLKLGLEFADLDRDGVVDVLTPAINQDGSIELRA